ncbi:nicotinate phosphoribosyltransferase [Hujiaoplasma nucleasis]|uniref:Nicotinate phosphoribosyltransferase n=2 Tax=Hujiaoplasma nucleasis TaxID=2725268 RepID=A0A7L6N3D5_9MOLU|nr:nicotinate phosphoribosyltransferase [Hujiaoplasma nucleasis]
MNKAMVIDFYELTMANGYFESGMKDQIAYFDLYYRKNPDGGGYALFAGLETIMDFIDDLSFDDEDIEFLKSKKMFSEGFLKYLRNFKFSGDIYSFKEGSIIFPNEPIVTIKAPIIEAQILETYLLQVINHQTLIATKASRIKYAAKGRTVIEMGARRAQGLTASLNGARAAYIGGIDATSNVISDQVYGVPSGGTMAHSWIQMFDSEYEAFKTYANIYPNHSTFLLDTYDTLSSGVPNAIRVIKEVLIPKGVKKYSVRIDSGDLTYLSKATRKLLDQAGLENCTITVSNSLDERIIKDLLIQGAPIDIFGVGERLITAKSDPVFGSVYKLVAIEENNEIVPKIKISDNVEKITTPHFKTVWRIMDEEGHFDADLISLDSEKLNTKKPLTIFDPINIWKQKTFDNYQLIQMHEIIYENGQRVYERPSLKEIRDFAQNQLNSLWPEVRRFDFPHQYYVDLSKALWKIKNKMIEDLRG